MRPFLHDQRTRYARMLEASTEALRACIERDLDSTATAAAALDSAAREYAAMGLSSGENEMVALQTQVATAHDGVDPTTLARVTVRRRELERTVVMRVLGVAAERLRIDESAVRSTLEQARQQLAPLVVHALGSGYVTPGVDGSITQAQLQEMWGRLVNDAATARTARLVALDVNASDLVILLGDLLSSFSTTGVET